jgi:hypothetical protein
MLKSDSPVMDRLSPKGDGGDVNGEAEHRFLDHVSCDGRIRKLFPYSSLGIEGVSVSRV